MLSKRRRKRCLVYLSSAGEICIRRQEDFFFGSFSIEQIIEPAAGERGFFFFFPNVICPPRTRGGIRDSESYGRIETESSFLERNYNYTQSRARCFPLADTRIELLKKKIVFSEPTYYIIV